MKNILKISLTALAMLALVGCGGGTGVASNVNKASVVTDSSKQQEIIETVNAVAFKDLGNIDMSVKASAKVSVVTLSLDGSYVTKNWGSDDASTEMVLNLTSPMKVSNMMKSSGNGSTMTVSTEEVSLLNGSIKLIEASEPTLMNSLIKTNDAEVVKQSLLAELAGMKSEDFSKIRVLEDNGETTYYIDVLQSKFMELIGQFGLQGITLKEDPVMGFTYKSKQLSGLSMLFNASYNGVDMEVTLLGTIK
ncbi:MAG: hypothetical protein PHF91_00870 [Bacilli bacterium]|nr:hypothetical protein [Bacilli bacterium]